MNLVPFPQTTRDKNDLSDSQISTAEMSDDCMPKFNSLIMPARDQILPQPRTPSQNSPDKILSDCVTPVNCSDSFMKINSVFTFFLSRADRPAQG